MWLHRITHLGVSTPNLNEEIYLLRDYRPTNATKKTFSAKEKKKHQQPTNLTIATPAVINNSDDEDSVLDQS